jgi:hypothetical protein
MFLKDKYLASGVFEKFKARLVAGGHQLDKRLYENLSSPTVATSSVLAIEAIAAAENRQDIMSASPRSSNIPTTLPTSTPPSQRARSLQSWLAPLQRSVAPTPSTETVLAEQPASISMILQSPPGIPKTTKTRARRT